MKLDERTVIPTPREGNHNGNKDARSPSENHNSSTHHRSYSNSHTIDHFSTFDHNKSPPRAEADHSDRSSHYAHIPSQSADSHFNRQKPISLEGISLNEREKKWWDELRETAGNLADFASFVHRTGRIPPRNDLDWARSNFQLFAENMSALQSVLRGEGPRYPEAGLNTLSISNSSRYGTRLMSQSPTLEGGNSKPLSTTFPPPLNRHVSYDKVNIPERSMRPSTSLSALTGERSEIPHLRPTPSLHDQRWIDSENNRWQERSAERNRAKESMRLDIPPESNFPPRDRTSSSNGRSFISSNEQEYSFEIAGPSRLGGTVPPPLASPHGNLPRHPNDSPRSPYSAREPSSSRVLETDPFNHRPTLHAQQHGGNNPAGLPVPQPPSRPFQPGRRASSDYGGTPYPTSYSPPYHQNKKGDERYSFRPPSDHYSAQNNSRTPSGYYRDEYRDNNHHDHSYVSGDESGSGSMGFRPSKYRKRSRAPAPGSCVSCGVRDTPEWRRGPNGARTLCNACGLHFSKLLRRKKQEQGNDSANVTVEELRSSLKLPGNGSTGQMSPSF